MSTPLCIMVIDDRACDRALASRVLKKVWPDCLIIEACDGQEAIELLENGTVRVPDIILLDVNMPRMSGHEFLEAWYTDSAIEIPAVFMLTSSDLPTDRELAERFASVRNYFVKPITKATAARLPDRAA